ncbi:hypothetical protein ABIC16_004172 [Sphingomonas sp. PvP055]
MRHQPANPPATEPPSSPIRPVSPPSPYIGGKRNLSRRLCALIDATPHDTYVEPFVGMGGVFLKRTRQPRAEVINDPCQPDQYRVPLAGPKHGGRSSAFPISARR